MAKGIRRKIKGALGNINREILAFSERGHVAAGLASEGYNGGYRDALLDISLLLDGIEPCRNREVWRKRLPDPQSSGRDIRCECPEDEVDLVPEHNICITCGKPRR